MGFSKIVYMQMERISKQKMVQKLHWVWYNPCKKFVNKVYCLLERCHWYIT